MSNHGLVDFIGVPMDLGADRRGVDMGPSAIRCTGILERIRKLGYKCRDLGDVPVKLPESRNVAGSRAKYLEEIAEACDLLRAQVASSMADGSVPIVAGGDHSIAMGTVAGVAEYHRSKGEKIGLLWVDAHADMNTPESSPSGNIHGMPLAVCLGLGSEELTNLGGFSPKVDRENTVLIGIRNLDDHEKQIVKDSGIHAYTMRDVDEHGMAAVIREAIVHLTKGTAGFHVSFDVDGLDPSVAPGVGTPVRGGLRFREAHLLMELLADTAKIVSLEVTEVNPILDHRNDTAEVAVDMMLSGLGKAIL
jgi:arginase